MTDEDKKDLIQAYHDKKAAGKLLDNLSKPTPGRLKTECLIVYEEKGMPKEDDTLRLFFETAGAEDGYRTIIEKADIDKFRPLVYLLNGKTESPNDKHYRLLAWLMRSEKREDMVKIETEETTKPVTIRKTIAALIVIVLACGLYWGLTRQCMYWAGDHYQMSSCDIKLGDTGMIAFDEQKARLKRINRPDTISYKAIGRVWYVKIDKGIEYYTAGGFHPIEYKKKLKPITVYMIDKYITRK
jgi:hypothetical protein